MAMNNLIAVMNTVQPALMDGVGIKLEETYPTQFQPTVTHYVPITIAD